MGRLVTLNHDNFDNQLFFVVRFALSLLSVLYCEIGDR